MKQVREQLMALAEEEYRKFNEKVIPGVTHMLGVRLPKMREIAKCKAKENPISYLNEIEDALCQNKESVYYEEIMVYGLAIGYAKFTDEERKYWLDKFRHHIDNWGVCDSCCTTYKWMRKNPVYWWEYLVSCIEEGGEYSVRFAVVCMLDHFVDDEYVAQILEWCNRICKDDTLEFATSDVHLSDQDTKNASPMEQPYYVQMAVAWAVSVCYAKYPKITHEFLKTDQMDTFTHNKSIQKICESFRVTKEQKADIRTLKRK
jgi:3-methyladenine DNA glycosylase AlkD